MTTIVLRRLEVDVGPEDETGGTANLTTSALEEMLNAEV
jgi:hypothetical protein